MSADSKSDEVCLMEWLDMPRPLKESCFSEQQINMLFELWRRFMFERFQSYESNTMAKDDIEKLYNSAITTKDKYNTLRLNNNSGVGNTGPAISLHEKEWVTNDEHNPTPFIKYVRSYPEIMESLKMSFKPKITHFGKIDEDDILNVLVRYVYWLKSQPDKSLYIVGVYSASNNSSTSVEMMKSRLKDNWYNARFHVALFNEDEHWRTILIDRKDHAIEYYDPLGKELDLKSTTSSLSINIKELLDIVYSFDNTMITKTPHFLNNYNINKRKDYEKHVSKCNLYVLFYIHTRVIEAHTMKEFVNFDMAKKKCKSLRKIFFDVEELHHQVHEKGKNDHRMLYGDYDMRLAGLEMIKYLKYFKQFIKSGEITSEFSKYETEFFNLIKSSGGYADIRMYGVLLQQKLLNMLPDHFKMYIESDIWTKMIQYITKDPLTKYLRKITHNDGKRSSNTKRVHFARNIYSNLVNWRDNVGAPEDKVNELNVLTMDLIHNFYIPILNFDDDNKSRFIASKDVLTSAEEFITKCMKKKDTVSFGVHLIREVMTWLQTNMKLNPYELNPELNKFKQDVKISKIFSLESMDEIREVVNKCDLTMQKAHNLLKSVFMEKMNMTDTLAPGTKSLGTTFTPLQDVQPSSITMNNMFQSGTVKPISTSGLLFQNTSKNGMDDKLNSILFNLIRDFQPDNYTFFHYGLKSYYFPINVGSYLNFTSTNINFSQDFIVNSLNETEMSQLYNIDEFRKYYSFAVLRVNQHLTNNELSSDAVTTMRIMMLSLMQFIYANNNSEHFLLLCALLRYTYSVIMNHSTKEHLKEMLSNSEKIFAACRISDNKMTEMIRKIASDYNEIYNK